MRKNFAKDMMVGEVHKTKSYGDVVITEYSTTSKIGVRFIDTGYEAIATAGQIRKGSIKDKLKPSVFGVGFIGDGIYKATLDGDICKAYYTWHGMMARCYSEESLKLYPTYLDCEVCEEWQEYQEFAKWHEENYPKDGLSYEIDKDIKIEGNRIYSPETCLFVTQKENVIKANAGYFSVKNPKGEKVDFYNLNQFCRDNNLTPSCLSLLIRGKQKKHKGWTRWLF